ncbi:EAL domain-containing protein [Kamptonema cortianum]|nr:EAL domain-containing protein [Kamptonema cortianum]
MYAVKGANRADYALFDETMDQELSNRLELEGNLRDGLDRGEFWLAIQPMVDLRTGIPLGGEGLARWTRPDGTDIPPSTFIPIAESCGLIHRLGMTSLHEVCRALDELKRDSRTSALRLSVNVSGIQLSDPTFADQVIDVIQGYEFDPHNLTLEITESVFLANLDGILGQLHKLREHGIAIALDDFGKGYSSLSMLVNLPLDTVKIDKSFVAEMCNSARSYTLIKSMITLAKSLDLKLVAEGVEHSEQAEELRDLNCPYVQGFHFARPMDLARFIDWSSESLHRAA